MSVEEVVQVTAIAGAGYWVVALQAPIPWGVRYA
jgi:hypothetical protein